MGKVEVAVQFAGSPYLSGFNTTVFKASMIDEVRFLAVLEIKSDIITEPGLVPFDSEMIMRLPALNYIVGKLALCQQGIGGDLLALDIYGIKQGNCHLDLVGLFGVFVTFSRQCPYFFWA